MMTMMPLRFILNRFPAAGLPAMVAVLLALATSGCNIVAPIAYIIEGPPTTGPLYQLPAGKVVVFIDDRGDVVPRARLRTTMATRATTELLNNVETQISGAITPTAIARVTDQDQFARLLPIDEIGRRVGADIVIYATVERFELIAQAMPRPTAVLRVKIIDSNTGQRLWPTGLDGEYGYRLVVQMGVKTASHYEPSAIDQLQEQLADFTGLRLAQIFLQHEVNPLDGRVNP